MRAILPAVLLVALLAAPGGHAVHGTSQSKAYTLGGQATFLNACESSQGIGGVRFCGVDAPAPAQVTVTIVDLVNVQTGVQVQFAAANGNTLYFTNFCGQATINVPAGTSEVRVFVSSVLGVTGGCIGNPGTRGNVTLSWSAA